MGDMRTRRRPSASRDGRWRNTEIQNFTTKLRRTTLWEWVVCFLYFFLHCGKRIFTHSEKNFYRYGGSSELPWLPIVCECGLPLASPRTLVTTGE